MGCMTCCSSVHSPKKRLNKSSKRVINEACLTEGAKIKSLVFVGLWTEEGGEKKGLVSLLLRPGLQKYLKNTVAF